jgi:hypothetical protein
MNRNSRRGRGLHHRRPPLIVFFVIPAVLCAFAVKSARASFYESPPILCEGVADDTAAPILCALLEETTKESSSKKAGPHALGKIFCLVTSRSRGRQSGAQPLISFAASTLPFKRQLTQRAGSSDDPDSPH